MFGKRPDGRTLRNVAPLQKIMPYIMKKRYDSMNMYEETFDCAGMDAYIKEKAEQGIKMNYMYIFIAAIVRLLALRPQLNRFVMNGRIYARDGIWVSFVVHPTLTDGSTETTIKLRFEGTETILEIAETLDAAIRKETVERVGENGTDTLARVLTFVPHFLIRFLVNTLMWMDRHCLLPKFIIKLSPFHTSFFITNLKSLGIGPIYHHTYEFGTTGLFFGMGKEKIIPAVEKDEIVQQKHMPFMLVCDERFCDGLYFALSLRQLRKYMRNPKTLEKPLDKRVEDVK